MRFTSHSGNAVIFKAGLDPSFLPALIVYPMTLPIFVSDRMPMLYIKQMEELCFAAHTTKPGQFLTCGLWNEYIMQTSIILKWGKIRRQHWTSVGSVCTLSLLFWILCIATILDIIFKLFSKDLFVAIAKCSKPPVTTLICRFKKSFGLKKIIRRWTVKHD